MVEALPDGEFHPEAYVTRGAFYTVVARLVAEVGAGVDAEALFDGGFTWALEGRSVQFVTGKEVVATLQRVAAARSDHARPGS